MSGFRVTRFNDAGAFSDAVMPTLCRNEAENNWPIGFTNDVTSGKHRPELSADRVMCGVFADERECVGVGIWAGQVLIVTRMPDAALETLATTLREQNVALPGVSGPAPSSAAFAGSWCRLTGHNPALHLAMTLMKLERVIVDRRAAGSFRPANDDDVPTLVPWAEAFYGEIEMPTANIPQIVLSRVKDRRLFVWCDPEPVSMAGCAGPSPHGMRVNFVFTPPAYHRRGYATACVAALSRHLLESGKCFVVLFVDTHNSSTNRIYRSIGYEPVCDVEDYRFEAPAEGQA